MSKSNKNRGLPVGRRQAFIGYSLKLLVPQDIPQSCRLSSSESKELVWQSGSNVPVLFHFCRRYIACNDQLVMMIRHVKHWKVYEVQFIGSLHNKTMHIGRYGVPKFGYFDLLLNDMLQCCGDFSGKGKIGSPSCVSMKDETKAFATKLKKNGLAKTK
jgi:hypothetical protein